MTHRGLLSVIAGLFALLIAGTAFHSCRVGSLKAANRDLALERQNAIAERDSTRDVTDRLRRVLDDSVRAVERLAVQASIRADALDSALGRITQAQIDMAATVRTLAARDVRSSTPTAEDTAGVRTAVFNIRQQPFTVAADVALPRPPAPGIMRRLDVAVDSANVGVRVQCGARDPAGVRPANVLATTPDWLSLRIGSVRADDEVCNPRQSSSRWKIRHGFFVGAGYGLFADSTTVRHGWVGAAGYGFNWSPFSR